MNTEHTNQSTAPEPFGYFKAEPFGWTDCEEGDEGAIALYDRPQAAPVNQQLLDALSEATRLIAELSIVAANIEVTEEKIDKVIRIAREGSAVQRFRDMIAAAEQGLQDNQSFWAQPRCACGDSFTSDAVCANCLAVQQQAVPVAAQCRFEGEEWGYCTIAHHLLVQAHPKEWPHYETRALYAQPPAVAVAVAVPDEWRSPSNTPIVALGDALHCWLAVKSKHDSKVRVYDAYYCNFPLMQDEAGDFPDWTLHDESGEEVAMVGWAEKVAHPDFNDFYSALGDIELIGWQPVNPPVAPTAAQKGGA